MKLIRIYSSFCSGLVAKNNFIRVCELEKDPDYKVTYDFVDGTENEENYSHVILLNLATPKNLKVSKDKVIGLAFEPAQFLRLTKNYVKWAKNNIGKYLIGSHSSELGGLPFIEHYGYIWHITPLLEKPLKPNTMNPISLMISNKTDASGHKYRHLLAKRILDSDLPIDIYGRGCKLHNDYDDRLKGEFEGNEPYEKYKFHIAIENNSNPHYFTEKITNPLLCDCVPIYWGCKHIDEYFPRQVITLNENIERTMGILRDVCENVDLYREQYKLNIPKIKQTINIKNVINMFD